LLFPAFTVWLLGMAIIIMVVLGFISLLAGNSS
jgi:hypothetical protein